jgi:hypothetical protein
LLINYIQKKPVGNVVVLVATYLCSNDGGGSELVNTAGGEGREDGPFAHHPRSSYKPLLRGKYRLRLQQGQHRPYNTHSRILNEHTNKVGQWRTSRSQNEEKCACFFVSLVDPI